MPTIIDPRKQHASREAALGRTRKKVKKAHQLSPAHEMFTDRLRRRLTKRVAVSGYRSVAMQIGINHAQLYRFLNYGQEIRSPAIDKIVAWLER